MGEVKYCQYALVLATVWLASATADIPGKYRLPNVPFQARGKRPGHSIGGIPSEQTVDVFLGPFCEDSRALYPTLQTLSKRRGAETDFRIHLWPLPYNLQSWLPAQACSAAAALRGNSSKIYIDCVALLYTGDNQKRIKTLAMVNGTSTDVIVFLVDLLASPLGIEPSTLRANLVQGLESGTPSYSQAKLSLKYGQSHGVFSTPSVLFNGVQIFGYDETYEGLHAEGGFPSYSVEDWLHLLDLSPEH